MATLFSFGLGKGGVAGVLPRRGGKRRPPQERSDEEAGAGVGDFPPAKQREALWVRFFVIRRFFVGDDFCNYTTLCG